MDPSGNADTSREAVRQEDGLLEDQELLEDTTMSHPRVSSTTAGVGYPSASADNARSTASLDYMENLYPPESSSVPVPSPASAWSNPFDAFRTAASSASDYTAATAARSASRGFAESQFHDDGPSLRSEGFQPARRRRTVPRERKQQSKQPNRKEGNKLILTDGFSDIPAQDRKRELNALHCVPDHVEENPGLISTALQELEMTLAKIRHDQRPAYDKAVFMNSNYVTNKDFRLMFLRSERFDVERAAHRMLRHFEVKYELFGLACLGRGITLDDLDSDTVDMYMSASNWFLDQYDRAGRRLFLVTGERVLFGAPANFVSFASVDNGIR